MQDEPIAVPFKGGTLYLGPMLPGPALRAQECIARGQDEGLTLALCAELARRVIAPILVGADMPDVEDAYPTEGTRAERAEWVLDWFTPLAIVDLCTTCITGGVDVEGKPEASDD